MNVELNDIAMFVEVARHLSFTKAAEAMALPSETLSRRVSVLEKKIGTKLLLRSTRHLALTPEGHAYLARCDVLVDQARAAHTQLQDMASQPAGRLSISMPVSLALLMLPEVMDSFMSAYPAIDCDFDLSMVEVDAIDNPYDVVLRFGQQRDSNLVSRQLALIAHQLYASRDYLDRKGTPLHPSDLAQHECLRPVIDAPNAQWVLHNGTRTERVAVQGRLGANSIGLCSRLAAQGLGVTPIPVLTSSLNAIQAMGLQRVLPEWTLAPISLYALLPTRAVPAKTQAFLAHIQPHLDAATARQA